MATAELAMGCPNLLLGQQCSSIFSRYASTCLCTCVDDVALAACPAESLPFRKQIVVSVLIWALPTVSLLLSVPYSEFSAVSLRRQKVTVLLHYIQLHLCLGSTSKLCSREKQPELFGAFVVCSCLMHYEHPVLH